MPVCEICGMEVVKVYTCSRCDSEYCEECGDLKNKLCYDCLGWESEELGDDWEDEGWDRSWYNEPH